MTDLTKDWLDDLFIELRRNYRKSGGVERLKLAKAKAKLQSLIDASIVEALAELLNHDNCIYDPHLGQVVSERVINKHIAALKGKA